MTRTTTPSVHEVSPVIPLASRTTDLVGSMIDSSTSLLAAQSHDIVRFAMGSPADEAVPVAEFRRIAGEVLDNSSFTYGATEGEPRLLELLVEQLATTPDPSALERLVITTGGMQGLDLAGKLFIDPGDLVVTESPTYTNGSATALSYGAELLEIPVDEEGMQVDTLEEAVRRAGRTPKAIYTIPTFQNPSGVTLSEDRRRELLRLAHRWGAVIIDDDPYGLLRFAGREVPTFQTLSRHDPLVFSVRTFSKILAPGWRVGWVDADPSLRQLLINGKQAMDTCTNVPNQHVLAEYISRGGLDDHLARLRVLYRERKNAMVDALTRHLGDAVSATDPEGGFFLWVTLRNEFGGVDTRELFEVALADGVAFIPGPALSPSGGFTDAMRLCFASSTPERIDEGVRRLARSLEKMVAGRG
ncbi:PLP-dependent aminotransferase family protein [Gordonia jinhuaensis]|uniref:Aspartate aminotransferase n=1 Tax=Gordonia jinhuaensis TaxID=1517702 RepID=A0A916WTC5_9ACTN|nr:PLP-dependent aminotransferase family protein [Gordonia jinhuaensis]GGB30945.1 aspartate aminotransferase [Gordonia jinhuaensis]